jgi:Ca2+-binding EF-hand superfamily protein
MLRSKKPSSSLSEIEFELLVLNTGLDKDQIKEWYTHFLIDYPNGYIKKSDFIKLVRKLYASQYQNGDPEKFAKFSYRVFDQDDSGRISFQEFLIATTFRGLGHVNENRRFELTFRLFDLDKNEKIDRKEMLKIIEAIYEIKGLDTKEIKEKVNEIFRQYDTDKSEYIDKNEFVNVFRDLSLVNIF